MRGTFCGCRTPSRPSIRRTPARGGSPNGRARAPPTKWKWSVSRGIATCGRWRQAYRRLAFPLDRISWTRVSPVGRQRRHAPTATRGLDPFPPESRVERVAQGVAEQIEGEDGEAYHDAGEHHEPRR